MKDTAATVPQRARAGRPDVAVVGGGAIGLACARELAGRGLRVSVLEAGEMARQASWASAGMLAPLAESPRPGLFAAICRAGRDLWLSYAPELADETGLDLDYDTSGSLALAEDAATAEARLAALEEIAAAMGEPCRRVGAEEARRLMPDFSPAAGELLLLPGEHRVDNRAFCAALMASLARRGAELLPGWPVAAIERHAGGVALRRADGETLHAGAVVIAAGAWSGLIAGLPPLPVLPVHGQMFALGGIDWPFGGCVRGDHFYAVRRAGGRLLVGATAEEAGFAESPTVDGIATLAAWVRRCFPGLGGRPLLELWSGLRPATPDRLPLVGRLDGGPGGGVLVATAHFRNGILLAPSTAALIAGLALGEAPADDLERRTLELFSPRRATIA